jgi:hypothetical protein
VTSRPDTRGLLRRAGLDLGEACSRYPIRYSVDARCLVDDPTSACIYIGQRIAERANHTRVIAARSLHLQRDALATPFDKQIDLGSRRRAPEEGLRLGVNKFLPSKHVLDHKRLPARAADRMGMKLIVRRDVQQMVQQPGITQIDLRRLDQPLADVTEIGPKRPNQVR